MIMRICACLMFLVLAAMPVFAQDQGGGGDHQPPSAADIVAKMQSKLNLSQDQVNAITPIIEKYSSKRQELRQNIEDGTADRDSVRGQMKQLKEDEDQELSQVLSADQMSQYKQMMQHRRPKDSEGNGGGESGGQGGGQGDSNGGGN